AINGVPNIRLCNWFQSLVFNVIDPISFKPLQNVQVIAPQCPTNISAYTGQGLYASTSPIDCFGNNRLYNFEYRYVDAVNRKKIMDFMKDSIPDGYYVIVRNMTLDPAVFTTWPQAFVSDWQSDQTLYGAGNSLYHSLKNVGFTGIDSFYKARPWGFVYKKNDASFTPKWFVGENTIGQYTFSVDCPSPDTLGHITSPLFGPARAWKQLKWRGSSEPLPGDDASVDVIGVSSTGVETTLFNSLNTSQQDYDVSSIDAVAYPYVKLRLNTLDTSHFTPFQLRYWRVTYSPVPEGAIAPNIYLKTKDSVDVGEPVEYKIAFKNISDASFDSLKVKMVITDRNNVPHIIPMPRKRPLPVNDTLQLGTLINSSTFPGLNTTYLEANPDNDQLEQFHFNNFAYRNLYVKPDSLNPLLDVTFDGVHILNKDIVASKPDILIKLKDEARWMILDDTSLLTLQVRYPDGSLRRFYFNNDTVNFVPAGQAPNSDNTATINFKPYFPVDGEYEMIVSGKDKSNNRAGDVQYRVLFEVINKPMISNMLNYPNPFTTSTAFVFTITGSEVPQNIKIEIMTITGRIVREITKEELGSLHIGRNITDFKWDGTDQYGQKLANGIYLYRVVTNLNGKSLDKYKAEGDNTDKYFNKGYGKMYLMR
ncbi:MAG TPA: T9SS type A sorting domain-containing protein, partial [Chitinophagaceae bacterium]|nr:T9SS type A sorting domain-containing protein [Chitinophagaceae bacterium]